MIGFFLSCLVTLRHCYYFIQAYRSSTEELPVKYRVSDKSLTILGIAVAYIISIIFTGLKLNG